jgi:superoxide dismutase, Fe-Mn family
MKKFILLSIIIAVLFSLQSCRKKKYTEVVEVPLPAKEDKMVIGSPDDIKATGPFQITKIPYKYDELVPQIDVMTMEIHYSRHYLTYTNNFNKLISGTESESLTIEEILKKIDLSDADLRNNAGGYYNHSLYFETIGPKSKSKPSDTLKGAIIRDFGSIEDFKSQFTNAALKQFGSGWAWLVLDKTGKLQITTTPNQDNPLMPKQEIAGTPILALDLWEHAYYLSYQNKRKKYIEAYFEIINWKKVNEKFDDLIKA